jgi:hypothetical protein
LDTSGTQGPTNLYIQEKDYTQKMDWDPGFRIGLGFDLPCAGMDVKTNWTDFHTKKTNKVNLVGSSDDDLLVTAGNPYLADANAFVLSDETETLAVKQKEHFDYDVINLEFGKWFSPQCTIISFRPHIGMQFVQFEEKRRFSGIESELGVFDHSIDSHIKQKFHGWGLRGGADLHFPLFCDISLVGGIAASIDWGRRSTSWNISNEFIEGTVTDSFYQKRHDKVSRSILDLNLGLRWDTTFCNCWDFSLEALWEQHQLFNASQLWHLNNHLINDNSLPGASGNNGDKHGDLSLRGLTVKAALTF